MPRVQILVDLEIDLAGAEGEFEGDGPLTLDQAADQLVGWIAGELDNGSNDFDFNYDGVVKRLRRYDRLACGVDETHTPHGPYCYEREYREAEDGHGGTVVG